MSGSYKNAMGYTSIASMASGETLTAEVDLKQAFDRVLIGIPTMASGADVLLQCAAKTGDTYRNLYHEPIVSSTTPVKIQVDSSITQAYVPFSVLGAQFIKVELSTAMTATSAQFDIIGISL
jgi:hypothetical protein